MLEGALEDNVLTLLCHDETHAAVVAFRITGDLFSTRAYRKIAEKALEYIITYSRPPGVHIRDLLEADMRRGEEGRLMGRVLDDMDTLHPKLQSKYVLKELDHFIAQRKMARALEDAADANQQGNVDEAERILAERDMAPSARPGIWLHDGMNMTSFTEEREDDLFTSGIDELDRRHCRPARQTVMLIIGPKKIGKSWWLMQLGRLAIMERKRVLHISLENSATLTAKRYIQGIFALTARESDSAIRVPRFKRDPMGRFSNLEFETINPDMIKGENRGAIARKLSRFSSRARLLIKEFPMGSFTIPQLTTYLDMLERTENFIPDLLLLDSVNKMSMRADQLRHDLGRNLTLLRGLATTRNMAVVTPTHSNRQGDFAKTVSGARHIGEDYSMLGTADTVCTISRTPSEKQHGLARILVDAARDSEDSYMVMISQSYATGQFCLDSVYMNRYAESEVNRLSGEDEEETE